MFAEVVALFDSNFNEGLKRTSNEKVAKNGQEDIEE